MPILSDNQKRVLSPLKASAKQFLADLVTADNVVIPAVDPRYDIDRFMEAGEKISFTDIALIELARTTGARIVTFDQQMLSLARS